MPSVILQFAPLAPIVWETLKRLPRTGWVKRGVSNPETVAEHTEALLALAMEAEPITPGGRADLLAMLEVHDWPEAITGDEVILTADPETRVEQKAAKRAREMATMKEICIPLGEVGQTILDHWRRFETSPDPIAELAREIDKFQAIEKALYFETKEHIPLFQEFLDYARPEIAHPFLVSRIATLEQDYRERV